MNNGLVTGKFGPDKPLDAPFGDDEPEEIYVYSEIPKHVSDSGWKYCESIGFIKSSSTG